MVTYGKCKCGLTPAKHSGRNWQYFNISLFWEALRCPYKRLVNYNFFMYLEDILRHAQN